MSGSDRLHQPFLPFTAQAAADAAVATKKTRRIAYEPPLRALVRRIQAHPGMTDSLRAQLGVTVPTRTRTRRFGQTAVSGQQTAV